MSMRFFGLFVVIGSILTSLSALAADGTHGEDYSIKQSDTEIRQKIIGTWIENYSFTLSNRLVAVSQKLTYATDGYYSATETISSDGKISVKKCEGLWALQNGVLTYSITNSIGVKPISSGAFFYPQARVIKVKKEQLQIFEAMDRVAFFEREATHARQGG